MESEFITHNEDELEEFSPENLAKYIFSQSPSDLCTKQLLPFGGENEPDQLGFVFEILITIYLEGLLCIMDTMKAGISEANPNLSEEEIEFQIYNNLTIEDLQFPEPWMKSIGYNLSVTSMDLDTFKKDPTKYYCRTIFKFNPGDQYYFNEQDIPNRYHFLQNRSYTPMSNLQDITAIIIKDNTVFFINFKYIF
jgi:hypothetical protein